MRQMIAFTACTLLLTASSFGQTITTADTTTAAPPSGRTIPALLSSTVPSSQDSRLVLAAKRTVALRQQSRRGSGWVIDNAFVQQARGGSFSVRSGTGAATAGSSTAPAVASNDAGSSFGTQNVPADVKIRTSANNGVDPAAEARRQEALAREMTRMRQESEQPYGDNVDEDLVDKRLSEIPKEMSAPPSPQPR